jgi:hypothetical protein
VSGPPVILVALALAGQPDIGPRIAQSATAAQALQGPLDGTWALIDRDGRARFVLQIVDPASRSGPLQGAWRDKAGAMGAISTLWRSGGRLSLAFEVGGHQAQVRLQQGGGGTWRGTLRWSGTTTAVSLRRGQPEPALRQPGEQSRSRPTSPNDAS